MMIRQVYAGIYLLNKSKKGTVVLVPCEMLFS
jgi:hypothetical protein